MSLGRNEGPTAQIRRAPGGVGEAGLPEDASHRLQPRWLRDALCSNWAELGCSCCHVEGHQILPHSLTCPCPGMPGRSPSSCPRNRAGPGRAGCMDTVALGTAAGVSGELRLPLANVEEELAVSLSPSLSSRGLDLSSSWASATCPGPLPCRKQLRETQVTEPPPESSPGPGLARSPVGNIVPFTGFHSTMVHRVIGPQQCMPWAVSPRSQD